LRKPRRVVLDALDFTEVGPLGVAWVVSKLDGYDDAPGSTVQLLQRLRGPGAWRSPNPQRTPQPLVLAGLIKAPSLAAAVAAVSALKSAASLSEVTLTVEDYGVGLRTMRVSRQGEVLARPITDRLWSYSVQLVAADPRKFGPPVTGTARLPSTSGGFTLPMTFRHTINAVTVTGNTSLTNPGTVDGPVLLRIDGPIDQPVVTHRGPDGARAGFGLSLSLDVGEFVVVDMEAQTVLAQGQSSRAGAVTARGWQAFKPGVNTWSLSAATFSAAVLLTVTASPTWE
jgi:hypothetical protein